MEWNQRNSKWWPARLCNYLQRHQPWRTVSARNCNEVCGNRRNYRHHGRHLTIIYHYLALCLLPVGALASEPEVHNSSNPVAAATGNVVNQNVNMQNTGAPSRQFFGSNNSCNGATMQFTPFYMGNDTIPWETEGYVRNNNYGAQLSFSVPLDGSMIELCKAMARRHEEKMRLDYELVRALKCTEIMKAGFAFRPGSRVEVLCHDIVPIVSIVND